jgi:hypothetical protein
MVPVIGEDAIDDILDTPSQSNEALAAGAIAEVMVW